jgi:hypothetical protein
LVGSKQNLVYANVMFDYICSDVDELTTEARSMLNCGSTVKWSFLIGARYTLSYANARCSSKCICAFGYCANSQFGCPYPQVDGLVFRHDGNNIWVSTTFSSTADVQQTWRLTLQSMATVTEVAEEEEEEGEKVKIEPIVQIVRLPPRVVSWAIFTLPSNYHRVNPSSLEIKFENMGAIVDSPCAQPMIISRLDSCSYGSIYPFSDMKIELKPARTNETIIHVKATYIPLDQIQNTARAASLDTPNAATKDVKATSEDSIVAEDTAFEKDSLEVPSTAATKLERKEEEEDNQAALVDDDSRILTHVIEFHYMSKFIGNVALQRSVSDVELVVSNVPCDDPTAIRAIFKTVSPCPEPVAMTLDIGFMVTACPMDIIKSMKKQSLLVKQLYFVGDTGALVTNWIGWSPLVTTATLMYMGREIQTMKPPDQTVGSITFYTDFVAPSVSIDARDLSVRFTNTSTLEISTKPVYQCVSSAMLRPSQEVARYLSLLAPTEDDWWSFQVQPAQSAQDFAEIVVLSNADRPASDLIATYYVFGNVIGVDDVQEDTESYFVLPYRFRDCNNAIARGIFAEFHTIGACNTTIRNKQTRLSCGRRALQFDARSAQLANIVRNEFNTLETPEAGDARGDDIADEAANRRPVIT